MVQDPKLNSEGIYNVYRCTEHFEIYAVHSQTNALFISLVKSFKFTHNNIAPTSLYTAHNTHAVLQSRSALHTTHMPFYSLALHSTQHTCRSTVSLCTAHNTHAALQSHSALHTTHMPLYDMLPHHLIYIMT